MSNLPELTIVPDIDHNALTQEIAAAAGITNLNASDPAYRIALAVAYRESLVRQDANEQARGVMLMYATGAQLDHIGVTYYRDAAGAPVSRLSGETDDDYRVRLQQSPEGLSVAGPVGAYIYHTRSYSNEIKDVSVVSPAPVEVLLTILQNSGDGSADDAMCQAVQAHLQPYRPITDSLTVQSAEILTFDINATLTLASPLDTTLIMDNARASLARYVASRHQLAGRVVESGVHAALTVEGVEQVTLAGWQDVICSEHQAPFCSVMNITEGA